MLPSTYERKLKNLYSRLEPNLLDYSSEAEKAPSDNSIGHSFHVILPEAKWEFEEMKNEVLGTIYLPQCLTLVPINKH